jgi:nitric-oxide synthase
MGKPAVGVFSVGLNLGRRRSESRRGMPGRGRAGRQANGEQAGAAPAPFGSFHASPVAVDEPAAAFAPAGLDGAARPGESWTYGQRTGAPLAGGFMAGGSLPGEFMSGGFTAGGPLEGGPFPGRPYPGGPFAAGPPSGAPLPEEALAASFLAGRSLVARSTAGPARPGTTRPDASRPGTSWPGTTQAGGLPPGGFLAGEDALAFGHLLASAERFITQFYRENEAGPPDRRLRQVRREVEATGTYRHTPAELTFGARVAWRNSARCIGRLYWHSLRVRDRREVTAAPDIAAESVLHLREATNGGKVRPVITVFAPDAPGRPGPRILNSELVRYAGHQAADGGVTGDPATTGVTRLARDLGWRGGRPPGRFDVLPLIVAEAGSLPTVHDVPADAVLEVPIHHPEFRWFADLGLRWYAVPVISDMYLDIGGVRYPAAPFNGWYMCTEIGSRDLGDTTRYDQLPVIARRMGLSTASDRTLWKDKAITELNLAVLHSYTAAGVTISDHHTESVRFLQHVEREERQGRVCPADWSWIVPPTAASATPVFHRTYTDFDQSPNFYRHPAAAALAPPRDPGPGGPSSAGPGPGGSGAAVSHAAGPGAAAPGTAGPAPSCPWAP